MERRKFIKQGLAALGASMIPREVLAQRSQLLVVDEYIAPDEGSVAERKQFAEQLFSEIVTSTAELPDGTHERLFPLSASGEQLAVRVLVFPASRILRILVIDQTNGERTPIFLEDGGLTGTPGVHQLPIELGNIPRPQGFAVIGEHELANRLYRGLLLHLLSRF